MKTGGINAPLLAELKTWAALLADFSGHEGRDGIGARNRRYNSGNSAMLHLSIRCVAGPIPATQKCYL